MNLPNRLTVGRLVLTVFFVAVVSANFRIHYTLALGLFVLAAATDYVDGEIARRYSLITDFGKLMDPLVDKIMTAAAFVCLVPLRGDPGLGGHRGDHARISDHGPASARRIAGTHPGGRPIGKHKTSWQIATVIFFLGCWPLRNCTVADWQHRGPPLAATLVLRRLDGQRDRGRADDLFRAGLPLAAPHDDLCGLTRFYSPL